MECEAETDAMEGSDIFSWPMTLEVDEEADQLLSTPQVNTAEEEHIPRGVISEALGATRFQAELSRPVLIGTLRGAPAYLLRTRFSFGRVRTNWFSKVQAADIKIVFEDAPTTGVKGSQHPAVAAYYPENFEGEISTGSKTTKAEAALNATYLGAGASITVGQSTTKDVKGRITVHGMRGGGHDENIIRWSIEEDLVAKDGIPRTVELPLIVTRPSQGRFSASVTVNAHYGFWRGPIATGFPVLGKNDSPLYFDPVSLASMAITGTGKGRDGRLVAEQAGAFDDLDLSKYSTFRTTPKD